MRINKYIILGLICIVIFVSIFFIINECIKYSWHDISLSIDRGIFTDEGYFLSEKLKSIPGRELTYLEKILKENKNPYPIEIIFGGWKFIKTKHKNSYRVGYKINLRNVFPNDSVYIGIKNIFIKFFDKDGFLLRENFENYNKEALGHISIFKDENEVIQKEVTLIEDEFTRLTQIKIDVQAGLLYNQ